MAVPDYAKDVLACMLAFPENLALIEGGLYCGKPHTFIAGMKQAQDGGVFVTPLAVILEPDTDDVDLTPIHATPWRMSYCLVCGNPTDAGESVHDQCKNDQGMIVLSQHDMDDHSKCHPNGCKEAAATIQDG